MDSPSSKRIEGLLATLIAGKKDRSHRHARALLQDEPRDEVVAALIEVVRRAVRERNRKTFERAANLLAEWGGDAAAEMLALQARTQTRFPRLAINALAQCRHPSVVPALLDILMEGSNIKRRRAAAYALARIGDARAVEPLCLAALKGHRPLRGHRDIGPDGLEALHVMGRTPDLARRVLGESSLSIPDRVRALNALAAVHPQRHDFWFRVFNPERFVARETIRRNSPVREEARAVVEYMLQHATLLRPAEYRGPEVLLRAASGPGENGAEELLRASDALDDDAEDDEDVPERSGLLRNLLRGLKGLLRR